MEDAAKFILGLGVILVALAAGFKALFWLWASIVQPFFGAIWAAIIAAPKIAQYTGRLADLLEGDVLARLEAGGQHFMRHDVSIRVLEVRVDNLAARVGAVDGLTEPVLEVLETTATH